MRNMLTKILTVLSTTIPAPCVQYAGYGPRRDRWADDARRGSRDGHA